MIIALDPNHSVGSDLFLTPATSLLGHRDRFASAPPSPPPPAKRRRLVGIQSLPSALIMPDLDRKGSHREEETTAMERRNRPQGPIEHESFALPRLTLRPRTIFADSITSLNRTTSSTTTISSCPESPTAVYDFLCFPASTTADVAEEEDSALEEPNKLPSRGESPQNQPEL